MRERTERTGLVALACASAVLLIAQHVVARAVRDALFLTSFPASDLPKVMLTAAAVGLMAVLAAARAMARFGPARAITAFLLLSSGLHFLEWRLLESTPAIAVVILYLHASIAGGIAVSGFWSVAGERFDPYVLRRAAGYIAAGSATGGLIGGVVVHAFAGEYGLGTLLLGLSASSVVAALMLWTLAGGTGKNEKPDERAAKVRSVTSSGYLRNMALLVTLIGMSSAVVDFAFKLGASTAHTSGASLAGFFANFYTVTSVVSVLLQLSIARWLPAHFGLGVALSAQPAVVLGLGALGVALSNPWVVVLLRGSGVSLETSLFRAAYEPLYAPLPLEQKRSTKTIIDVACDRLGEALGSGWVLIVAAFAPALAPKAGLVAAVVASAVAVWLSLRLERGYVAELAASLRTGRVRIDANDVKDATTRLTLSQTALELDRDALIREIEELRKKGSPSRPRSDSMAPASEETSTATALAPPAAGPLLSPGSNQRLQALQSGDVARVRSALAAGVLELELVSLVIKLLDRDDLAQAAVVALRGVARRIPGQLVDALLDPELPLRLRRRIPRVLRACPDRRAVRGLADALSDPQIELRLRSALALRDLTQQDPSIRPPRRVILEAAARELEQRQAAALEHVFTLLSLVLDADALDLARRALSGSDDKLRGTALEYLEHVVPEPVRSGIWPHLQAGRLLRPSQKRAAAELADELKRSFG
jgi:ATP:ADP antiporter, AAA family